MIKSKIDAREKALELAVDYCKGEPLFDSTSIVEIAENFESYLISDAELPEVVNDNLDSLTSFLEKREMALSGTPCKSENE